MTRWQAFIALICITQASFGQNHGSVGIEITEAFRNGNVRIRIGYAFTELWSAEAMTSFSINTPDSDQDGDIFNYSSTLELDFRHWIHESYKGTYFSFGVMSGFKKENDMKFRLGYSLPIWKGFGLDIGYGFMVLETIRQRKPAHEEITFELFYKF